MRSPTDVSYYLLLISPSISLLLGSIASPIIGGEQSWATLSEPEFLSYATPDAANLPDTSAPDTGTDWSSLTASWNNVQLENTAAEVVAPQQENIPHLISDGMVGGTLSPQPRGRPPSQHPELKEWDFRKYPGYPSEDSPDLYNPLTGMFWAQKRLKCLNGQQLFCCRPDDIKCCTCEGLFLFLFYFNFFTIEGERPIERQRECKQTWGDNGFYF